MKVLIEDMIIIINSINEIESKIHDRMDELYHNNDKIITDSQIDNHYRIYILLNLELNHINKILING